MNKEAFFISLFKNKFIGDDGAFIKGYVYSSDSFFENVHFKKNWMSYYEIASKAMLVNISDAIAMNAKAKYAILNCAIPKNMSEIDLIDLANGFKNTAKEYGIKIIGGDTIENTKLDISITIISKTKNPIYRTNIKNDDLLVYSGELGSVDKDLKLLLNNKKIPKNSKFIKPILKPKFFKKISKYINASIDISDGLYSELEVLSKASNVNYKFTTKIIKEIGCSGEEYEILFSIPKKYKKKVEKIAKKKKVKLNFFAIAKKIKNNQSRYISPCISHHF